MRPSFISLFVLLCVVREKEEAEAKISAQAVDAFAIIGDLDSALKAFQGALGLSDVRTFLNKYHY